LRTDTSFNHKEINLETNAPVDVYIAVEETGSSPLPGDFEDTNEVMTVYMISKTTKAVDNVIKAKKSYPYKIYNKKYNKGSIIIPLAFLPK